MTHDPEGAPPQGWPLPPASPPAVPADGQSPLAVAALVCAGLMLPLALVCGLPGLALAVAAIVLGAIALVQIGRSGGRQGGRGLAIAAIVVGALGLLAAVAMGVWVVYALRNL